MTKEENGTWAARLDSDLDTHPVSVVVALPVDSAELTFGDQEEDNSVDGDNAVGDDDASSSPSPLEAGVNGTVHCVIRGGRPAPFTVLEVEGLDDGKKVDGSAVQTPDEKGVYTSEEVRVNSFHIHYFIQNECGEW